MLSKSICNVIVRQGLTVYTRIVLPVEVVKFNPSMLRIDLSYQFIFLSLLNYWHHRKLCTCWRNCSRYMLLDVDIYTDYLLAAENIMLTKIKQICKSEVLWRSAPLVYSSEVNAVTAIL